MRAKQKEKKVRYEYSTTPDGVDQQGNVKRKVVKRVTTARPPQNLIDLLLLKKAGLYKREALMQSLKSE